MSVEEKISNYYCSARELVKLNNPKAARAYVLAILHYALETYNNASTILLKVKTQVFMDTWIAVSRELYSKGVTDYVLECFGLPAKEEKAPKRDKPKSKSVTDSKPLIIPQLKEGEIDISGLVDEASRTQGWCADVFEANKNAVVAISVAGSGSEGSGTGFIVSQNGYLLTNDHVVFDEDKGTYYPKITMSFVGEKKGHAIEVLFSDKKSDVALCSFEPEELKFASIKLIEDYSTVKQGADCLVIGNAFGQGLAPFTGVVRFTHNDNGNLVYTAPSNPGDSGGPVLNRYGECIGINKSKTVTINGTVADAYANATPMDKISQLLQKWSKHNDIKL